MVASFALSTVSIMKRLGTPVGISKIKIINSKLELVLELQPETIMLFSSYQQYCCICYSVNDQ